jgi:bifunctional non-homologous end joining protein LigD
MPLVRIPEAFSHPDWLFELKHDGFRTLAEVRGHRCTLTSRNGNKFKSWPYLEEEIAHSIRANDALLDGEIVCLDSDGRANFRNLLYRREWPYFLAFDLLRLEGRDVRGLPLLQRKHMLRSVMPRIESRLQYVDGIAGRGEDFYRVVCEHDLEGIVAKPKHGPYFSDGLRTNWLKIKNPTYTQILGREEMFAAPDPWRRRGKQRPLQLMLPVTVERVPPKDTR